MKNVLSKIGIVILTLFILYLSWQQLNERLYTHDRTIENQQTENENVTPPSDEPKTLQYMLNGNETVASVLEKLGPSVKKRMTKHLNAAGFNDYPDQVLILAFKEEQQVAVYGWRDKEWHFIQSYWFTAISGAQGPKLQQGDKQIPEGIYTLEYLNPNSKFWLSAKVSYPNAFDKEKAALDGRTKLGGDIFIHGKAQSIGCIAIGDAAAEEVFFFLAHHKHTAPPEIIISPVDFRMGKPCPNTVSLPWYSELCTKLSDKLNSLPFHK